MAHESRTPPPSESAPVVLTTRGPDATRRLGESLARSALPLPEGGLVVALHGNLGAGKTVFVQGVARGLGVPASTPVVSPTFTVARDYRGSGHRGSGAAPVTLHHVDAYRLRGPDDLDAAGYEDMWGDGRLTCVEWAERVEDAMPADRLDVTLEPLEDGGLEDPDARHIAIAATGPRSRRTLERLRRSLARTGAAP